MSSYVKAAAAFLAALAAGLGVALAQEGPAPATPKAPVPYAKAAPRPAARAAPRPAPRRIAGAQPARTAPATLGAYAPAVAAAPSGARLTPDLPLPPAELEAFVDGLVRDAMAREHIAGVVVGVVQRGQVTLKKGYGYASLDPARRIDPDATLFRIGSISKTFTWIALMKEVEAGRIRLETPLNLYLPEPLHVRDQGYDTPVRVSNLLDHSAGFEDRALGHLFENRAERERPLNVYLRQERPRRVREPGQISSYSNYGAALAGAAVSYVAQRPFERLIEDEIFMPLGLNHTTFRERRAPRAGLPGPMPKVLAANIADGYRWTPTGFQRRAYEFIGHIAPAGSASSTAGDMTRYMALLLNDGTLDGVSIYGPTAARAFRTPLRRTPPGINGWAHGFAIYNMPGGLRGYGHGGATLSFMSNLVVIPELGLGVFIAANTDTGRALTERLPERIVEQFYAAPAPLPRAGAPGLNAVRSLYEGYYITTRRARGGLESFVDLLVPGVTVDVTADGRLITSGAEGVRSWMLDGGERAGRFRSTDSAGRLAFGLRPGTPANFVTSLNGELWERAGMWKRPVTLLAITIAAGLAALATLAGIFARKRREFRESNIQGLMGQVQNAQAALWLAAIGCFAMWASKTSDVAQVMYGWPGAFLVLASACALVAAALTGVSLVALASIWRGGRRVDSWTQLHKAGFTLTALIYAALSWVLFTWGALMPWSG